MTESVSNTVPPEPERETQPDGAQNRVPANEQPQPRNTEPVEKPQPLRSLLLLSLPTVVLLLLFLLLAHWRTPTRVNLELVTRRVAFTIAGYEQRDILNNSVGFHSLAIEKFAHIELHPRRVAVADPAGWVPSEGPAMGEYPASAWYDLELTGPLTIAGPYDSPEVFLEGTDPSAIMGTLDFIRVEPASRVVLEVDRGATFDLTLKVEGEHTLNLPLLHDFSFTVDMAELGGLAGLPTGHDLLTFRVELGEDRMLDLRSQPEGLVLVVSLPVGDTEAIFSDAGIPLAAVELLEEKLGGRLGTPLLHDGQLTYPGYPGIKPVIISKDNFVALDRLGTFHLAEISLDQDALGLRLRFDGEAGNLRSGSGVFEPVDHRLTQYQRLQNNALWAILGAVAVWIFPTTVGGYELYKSFK